MRGRALPAGSQVVTCDWRETGELLLALPDRRYLVALAPMLFAAHDPERYRTWFVALVTCRKCRRILKRKAAR